MVAGARRRSPIDSNSGTRSMSLDGSSRPGPHESGHPGEALRREQVRWMPGEAHDHFAGGAPARAAGSPRRAR